LAKIVGRVISRFRYQRGWTQESLAANMQILGCDASRAVIANIETGRTQPTYKQLMVFSEVFPKSGGFREVEPRRGIAKVRKSFFS